MEAAIQSMVTVFLKSSKGKESLGKKEFQKLVSGHLSNILLDTDSKEAIDKMANELDTDKDGRVAFEEYMKLVGSLACSLSKQRCLEEEKSAKNNESGQVAQNTPNKEDGKPEGNVESTEGAKPKENEEPKADATGEAKVEATAGAKVEAEVKVKAEGEPKFEEAKEQAAAATVEVVVAAAVEEVKKGEEKVEEDAEKLPVSVEEEGKKNKEEAAS